MCRLPSFYARLALFVIGLTVPSASADPPTPLPPRGGELSKSYELFKREFAGERVPELVQMLWAIDKEEMGPNKGWFHPGQSRYGWSWLAARYDANHDGKIDPQELQGRPELLSRLDRNKDKTLTEADLDWSKQADKSTSAWSQLFGKAMGALMKKPAKELLVRGLFKGEIGSIFEGPKVGDAAPDFSLKTQDGKQEISLAQYRGKKPVVLIFGSFT